MSDEQDEPKPHVPTAWAKLWHPKGIDVRLPIPLDGKPVSVETWQAVLASVENAFTAGWLIEAPGMGEGEHKDMIGWVCKRQKENEDGSLTPIVDLYPDHEQMEWSILSHYLNRPQDQADFERASGLKIAQLPAYIGAGKLQRNAGRQTDAMIIRAAKPFAVAWKNNPKFNPAETDATKKKPKRIFSRWPDLPAAGQSQVTASPPHNHEFISKEQAKELWTVIQKHKIPWDSVAQDYGIQGLCEIKSQRYFEVLKKLQEVGAYLDSQQPAPESAPF